MSDVPKISDAEWEVMKVVWDKNPITASEVVDKLSGSDWSPYTIKAMLNHLLKKGALSYKAEGNRYFYRPAISKEKCTQHESKSFLKRVFDGAADSMLVHFVQNTKLTASERQRLKQILEREQV
jgi:BlaI family transcriptional regulator, penicillinase repressor